VGSDGATGGPARSVRVGAAEDAAPVPAPRPRPRTAWLGLLGYLVGVAVLTLVPQAPTGQLLEFRDQLQWLLQKLSGGRVGVSVAGAEALANVVLFVPIGLLLRLALPRPPATALLLLALASSTAIEAVQYLVLPARIPSLVDVLTNSAGAAFGLVLGVDVQRAGRWSRRG
jgi:glycopeptide antibiotics resistance protein